MPRRSKSKFIASLFPARPNLFNDDFAFDDFLFSAHIFSHAPRDALLHIVPIDESTLTVGVYFR